MGKQWKQWQTLFSWAPKSVQMVIAAMKLRRLLLGRKVMTNLDSILKSRDITLLIKVHLVKTMFFPVVMFGCESWTVKKAEHQRIDAFELWFWRRLLRVPWSARSNQSILKEISPEYSLEGLMLKLQYLEHLMRRTDTLEKDPDAGKDWRQEERGKTEDDMVGCHPWLDGHEFEQAPVVGDRQGSLACCSPWGHKDSDMTEWLKWTDSQCQDWESLALQVQKRMGLSAWANKEWSWRHIISRSKVSLFSFK